MVKSDFTPCQLATMARAIPSGSNWLFEPKYDGYRCQLVVRSSEAKLFTRNGLDWSARLGGTWLAAIKAYGHDCVIDGEICVLDSDGRPDFGLLCKGLSDSTTRFSFFAFDLLGDSGGPLTGYPQSVRKERLAGFVRELGLEQVKAAPYTSDGSSLFDHLKERDWEGMMAKDANAPYQPGIRSPAWRKIKFTRRQEFVVAGWRPDQATGALKSIVLGTMEERQLVLRGSVGSGFSSAERLSLPALFSRHSVSAPRTDPGARWLQPRLVAEIEFLEFSSNGCVRGASYLGLREDKSPTDVILEGACATLR